MNYTPALIPHNTPDGSAAITNASVGGGRVSLNFSTFHLVSLNYAKLQFARFGRNCNFPNPPATSPYRVITISITH